MKVLLRVPLSIQTGYGNDGLGLCKALLGMGADLYLDPTTVDPPVPQEIANLLTKSPEPPFDMTIIHVDPAALKANPTLRRASGVLVGWTMWEYSNLKNLPDVEEFRDNVKNFDALVAYDEVTKQALAEHYDGPILVLQGGYWPEDWQYVERDWFGDRFGFCMAGQLHERKDPFVAIQAFQQLKHEYPIEFEPAELHLKTTVPGLHSKMEEVIPKLRVHYAVWPKDILEKFYSMQHCLLSPSRGEGKNMPALEFQSTGGVVIATNWAGHTQWLNPDYSYPLDYTLHPVNTDFPDTYNARASVEHLKELMLHVFRNREESKRKGKLASEVIPWLSSWDNIVARLFRMVISEVPRGKHLQDILAVTPRRKVANPDGDSGS